MPKIDRYNGNLKAFASEQQTNERTLFGQTAIANDLTSQVTAQFLRGWGIVGPSDQPSLQDFNAAMYTNGQLLAYLHQMGVAEYNATQEYYLGSVTQVGGVIYISLQNANTGRAPASNPAWWREPYPQATTTLRGTALIASNAEALAGVEATKIMTPSLVKASITANAPSPSAATEAAPGITRYSTQAEVNAGSAVQAATKPDQVKLLFDSGAFASIISVLGAEGGTLTQANLGQLISVQGITAPSPIVMINSTTVPRAGNVTIINDRRNGGNITINRAGSDQFFVTALSVTSLTLKPGEWAVFSRRATGQWYVAISYVPDRSIGIGQTWQDVSASRTSGTTYTNTTASPIMAIIQGYNSGSTQVRNVLVDGVPIATIYGDLGGANRSSVSIVIPPGSTYSAVFGNLQSWSELR